MGRGGAKTAIGGGGAGARKQLSAAGARAFENTGQRWGRGCAKTPVGGGGTKTPVGGGGSVVPLPPLPLPGGLKTTGRKNKIELQKSTIYDTDPRLCDLDLCCEKKPF